MLGVLRASCRLCRSGRVVDDRLPRFDRPHRWPLGRQPGRISAERLANLFAARIVDDEIDAGKRAIVLQHINGAVVAEHRDRETCQRAQRRFVVQRRRQKRARVGKKSLLLLDAATFRDVHEDPDGAPHLARGTEQRRGIFHQGQRTAIGADHIDDDAADFGHLVCGAIHRAVLERHRPAVDEILLPRSLERNLPERRLLGIVEAKQSGERSIHSRRSAFGIVGNGDADR